jgi:hypothetical protein
MEMLFVVVGLVLFAFAASRWGVDSRDDFRNGR